MLRRPLLVPLVAEEEGTCLGVRTMRVQHAEAEEATFLDALLLLLLLPLS
jgi:hypothetical protein